MSVQVITELPVYNVYNIILTKCSKEHVNPLRKQDNTLNCDGQAQIDEQGERPRRRDTRTK